MIGVMDSTLASDPERQLRRVLQFLGQNSTGVECALKRSPPPQETTYALKGEAKEKWEMVMFTLNASSIQVQWTGAQTDNFAVIFCMPLTLIKKSNFYQMEQIPVLICHALRFTLKAHAISTFKKPNAQ